MEMGSDAVVLWLPQVTAVRRPYGARVPVISMRASGTQEA